MSELDGLLPHGGTARMIERVVRWDQAQIVAATARHRAADNPLRHAGRLAAVHLAEFAAQTMAIHGGLRNRAAGAHPRPAVLVAVRDLELRRERIDLLPGEIEITARVLLASASAWQYAFEVHHVGERIASGRVAAMAYDLAPRPGD
jgi:predicted hotdog family 3-hydroxylacyl-ACP dehydratase